MALHIDTLRLIAVYWNGRMLGLTCRALTDELQPNRHIIIRSWSTPDGNAVAMMLPNGMHHGLTNSCCDDKITELKCVQGNVVDMTQYAYDNGDWFTSSRQLLINGSIYSWWLGTVILLPHYVTFTYGDYCIIGVSIREDAFERVAREHAGRSPPGKHKTLTPVRGCCKMFAIEVPPC